MIEPTRIVVLMGVSGTGKTTIGHLLAQRLGWDFRDGDEFHSAGNIQKMKSGHPLSDGDRMPWLDSIRDWISGRLADNAPAVVTCSALKESYRRRLCLKRAGVRSIFLSGEYGLISERLADRNGHFMPASLLQSQFDILEEPSETVTIDIRTPPAQIVAQILSVLGDIAPAKAS